MTKQFMNKLLLLNLLAGLVSPAVASQSTLEITQKPGTADIRIVVAGKSPARRHTIAIDDAYGFSAPVVKRTFSGSQLELDGNREALIPGIDYYVELDGVREVQRLRLATPALTQSQVSCATLRHTWEVTGRFDVGTALSGLKWVGDHWVISPHTFLPGESLYNAELILRPAVTAARACHDLATLDEVSQYYTIMLQQTETVAHLLSRQRVTAETMARLGTTDPKSRTFSATFGEEAGEGELYNSQWLHPAAFLVRLISEMPEHERTPAMSAFAKEYSVFIVRDQLKRYLFEQQMPALGGVPATGRVAYWEQAMQGLKGAVPWDTAMSDIDLWLLASAAEMVGANANDPQLVAIDVDDLAMLHFALSVGVQFFQSKRTLYPDTKNFQGEIVGSASYFNGDYAAEPDMAYSAVTGEQFPSVAEKGALPQISWDSSHIYRLPVFLRALYENRRAVGLTFPKYEDLRLVTNQYTYKVFNGDYSRPIFHNYFDGSDGWFRVDYNGSGFGHPPSGFCDMRNPKRSCLMPGEVLGWSQLAFANEDLSNLEQSLVALAFSKEPGMQEFRDRHFFYGSPYKVNVVDGADVYGGALYFVIAENADMISSVAGKSATSAHPQFSPNRIAEAIK